MEPISFGLSLVFLVDQFLMPCALASENCSAIETIATAGSHVPRYNICNCMDYWDCILSGGVVFNYCGVRNREACCSVKKTAEPLRDNNHDSTVSTRPLPSAEYIKSEKLFQLLQASSQNYVHSKREQPQPVVPDPTIASNTVAVAKIANTSQSVNNYCGMSINNGHIDSFAKFKEWPWHVAILEAKDDVYICGGSFVQNKNGSQLILTTAHCVENYTKTAKRLKVRLGEYDVSTNLEPVPHVEVLVRQIIPHPNSTGGENLENDIAVLKLNNSIQLSTPRDNIRPVCLPNSALEFNNSHYSQPKKCVVTGWGRRNEYSHYSVILKEIAVPVWPSEICSQKLNPVFGPNYTLPTGLLCAGEADNDACDGDGGGGMFCHVQNHWALFGIVSFGIGCGGELPGIYTNVSFHMQWVNSLF